MSVPREGVMSSRETCSILVNGASIWIRTLRHLLVELRIAARKKRTVLARYVPKGSRQQT